MILEYIVKDNDFDNLNNKITVNYVLFNKLNLSNRLFTKLINLKKIYLNDVAIDTRSFVNVGDKITIDFDFDEDNSNIIATKMDLQIIFEDDWFLVISKPRGIAVHPSILHYADSLSNGIKFYFDSINLHKKIRPVNRLDLYTSGLIVFAKNEYVQECLIKQMYDNVFSKKYLALTEGIFDKKSGSINAPIARKENSIIERTVSDSGKYAITDYEVLEEFNNYSVVKCILKTGRTHQIRVHMSYIGHPIVGDFLYGGTTNFVNGQLLHCYEISFVHPIFKKVCKFKDDSFLNILETFKKESSI